MARPVSRRTLIGGASALGLAASATSTGAAIANLSRLPSLKSPLIFHSPDVAPFRQELPRLPVLTGPRFDIAATTTTHRFHPDWDPSPAFGYGGRSYLGPIVENHRDVPTRFTIRNQLGTHPFADDIDTTVHGATTDQRTRPNTVLHMHGGETPPSQDGHPHDYLVPGEAYTHTFPNQQEAAALWYHDHSMGTTRLNVYAGLASMYLLRDRFDTGRPDNPLGLPAGEYEVPLMLQEKIFRAGGRQSIRSTPIVPQGQWEGGAVGDVGVVNGAVWPQMAVARGLYRFRLINAASYSVLNLHFSNRMLFWIIGSDGGLLNSPARTTEVRLAPAERLDVLVDFSGLASGETVELRNDEAPPGQAAILGEVTMPLFCRFKATSSRGFRGAVPTRLRGGRNQPALLPPVPKPQKVRNVTVLQQTELRIPPAVMSLNNLGFESDDIEMPKQGTTEQWNIINVTQDPHPIHIHLVMFRILNRQSLNTLGYQLLNPMPPFGKKWAPSPDKYLLGSAVTPPPWEQGRKDTVRTDGNTVTRVIIRWPTADELGFDPDASFMPHGATAASTGHQMPDGSTHVEPVQGYVWHCHILDHEDHDMMLRFRTPA